MLFLFLSLMSFYHPSFSFMENTLRAAEEACEAKAISITVQRASALAKEKKWVEMYEKLNMRLNNCTFELSPQKKSELLFWLVEATVGMGSKSLCQEKLKQMDEVKGQASLDPGQIARIATLRKQCAP